MKCIYYNLVSKKIVLRLIIVVLSLPAFAKDVSIVAIPEKCIARENEKIGVYIEIENLLVNEDLFLMGGLKSKKGIIHPISCGYELKLYDLHNGLLVENFARTGSLSQELPFEDFDERITMLKLASSETAFYFVEIEPFPNGVKGKYCVVTFMILTNKKNYEITINFEKNISKLNHIRPAEK